MPGQGKNHGREISSSDKRQHGFKQHRQRLHTYITTPCTSSSITDFDFFALGSHDAESSRRAADVRLDEPCKTQPQYFG